MNIAQLNKTLIAAAVGALLAAPAYAWNEGGGEQGDALTLEPDLENGLDVYEVCSACHLPEGWGSHDGTFPQIAGQHASVAIKQLADIRAGNRDNPTMYPFAQEQSIGDAQALADVVAYMQNLKMDPDWNKGPWEPGTAEYERGGKLYADNCTQCHGETGLGNAEEFYPRINGQHYTYMVRQFEWIRDGKRRNANPEMVEQIKNFTDQNMKEVVNWVSWQQVPAEDLAPSKDWQNPDFK